MNFSHKCEGKHIWDFPLIWGYPKIIHLVLGFSTSYWGTSIYGTPQIQPYQRNGTGTRRLNCCCGAFSTRGACPCHRSCQPCEKSKPLGMWGDGYLFPLFPLHLLCISSFCPSSAAWCSGCGASACKFSLSLSLYILISRMMVWRT